MKGAHHRGTYHVRSRRLVALAKARDMLAAEGHGQWTRCWRDGLTLAQHRSHRDGRRPWWTAGHVTDGDPRSPLAPEASVCNFSEGAKHGNRLRSAAEFVTSRSW